MLLELGIFLSVFPGLYLSSPESRNARPGADFRGTVLIPRPTCLREAEESRGDGFRGF
jgi:hypothetical protein